MTKPQAANEPSMEDILASIRKMISEDRLDARPIPDQIARASIGERAAPRPVPKPVGLDEKVQSGEGKSVSVPPAVVPSEPAAPERPGPSFSSLSDALKSAAPGSVRPSLDDKLSNMLDDDGKRGPKGREENSSRCTARRICGLAYAVWSFRQTAASKWVQHGRARRASCCCFPRAGSANFCAGRATPGARGAVERRRGAIDVEASTRKTAIPGHATQPVGAEWCRAQWFAFFCAIDCDCCTPCRENLRAAARGRQAKCQRRRNPGG